MIQSNDGIQTKRGAPAVSTILLAFALFPLARMVVASAA